MDYLPRIADTQLRWLLAEFGGVLINGARGVGKSTTAGRVASTVYDLDDPEVLAEVTADPHLLVRGEPPILIDEWQRYPESMNLVKLAIDKSASPGQFILTGTPSHNLGTSIHSGAGRLPILQMLPMSLAERALEQPTVSLAELLSGEARDVQGDTTVTRGDYAEQILRSGFPGTRDMSTPSRTRYLDGYIQLLLRRDVPQHLQLRRQRLSAAVLRQWLVAYSESIATDAYFTHIAKVMERREGGTPDAKSIRTYVEGLQDLGVLDPLPYWPKTSHHIGGIKKRDKHHLVDPGLATLLLDIRQPHVLEENWDVTHMDQTGQHRFGKLFESLVTQSVRAYADACDANTYWLGTTKEGKRAQREVDLIIQDSHQRIVAIEVKLGDTVSASDVRHLRWLRGEMGARWADGLVVNTGSHAYRRDDGIAVVPASLLGP